MDRGLLKQLTNDLLTGLILCDMIACINNQPMYE